MTAMTTKERGDLLTKLAEVSGAAFQEEDLTYEGDRLVIPAGKSAEWAVQTLENHMRASQKVTRYTRQFKFRPWDGAAAAHRAIKKLTGTSGVGKATWSFFTGSTPPQLVDIPVSVDETIQVPWGEIEVALFDGTLRMNAVQDRELGQLFQLEVDCPRKYRAAVEGLFAMVQHELETASIYRGKAFNGAERPDFVDLRGVDPRNVVYSEDVMAQLQANVWSVLDYTEAMRENNVPLKRSVLLHGPYGTGKTLAAFLTAQRAIANGWTFIYCRPGKDDLDATMQTARLYQPAVVFFEDVDVISDATQGVDQVSTLLDMFDGITAKGTELMVILTTNHVERIHKGMVRPGRLDAMVEIGHLDATGVERLIKAVVPGDKLDGDIDYQSVFNAMEGFLPAFVKEATDRAKRYSIARNHGQLGSISEEDLILAAGGLRPQLDIMNGAHERPEIDSIDTAISRTVRRAVDGAGFAPKGQRESIQYEIVTD